MRSFFRQVCQGSPACGVRRATCDDARTPRTRRVVAIHTHTHTQRRHCARFIVTIVCVYAIATVLRGRTIRRANGDGTPSRTRTAREIREKNKMRNGAHHYLRAHCRRQSPVVYTATTTLLLMARFFATNNVHTRRCNTTCTNVQKEIGTRTQKSRLREGSCTAHTRRTCKLAQEFIVVLGYTIFTSDVPAACCESYVFTEALPRPHTSNFGCTNTTLSIL